MYYDELLPMFKAPASILHVSPGILLLVFNLKYAYFQNSLASS